MRRKRLLAHRLFANRSGTFDGAVRQVAGGMVFEQIGEDVEPVWRGGERRFGPEIRAVGQGETLLALNKIRPARKSA